MYFTNGQLKTDKTGTQSYAKHSRVSGKCVRCHTHTVRQAFAVLFVVVVGNEVVAVVVVLKPAGYPYLDETGVFQTIDKSNLRINLLLLR